MKKRTSKKKILLFGVIGLVGLCVIIGIIGSLGGDKTPSTPTSVSKVEEINEPIAAQKEPTKTKEPTPTKVPTNTKEPTNTPEPTATPDPNRIESGTYLINSEIKPGLYKGTEDNCYWERLKDLSGSFDAIKANGNSNGQFYIQVDDSDYALNTDCDLSWLETLPELSGDYPIKIRPGEYLVNNEIKPGIYKGTEADCYWERKKGLSGDFDDIIANGNTSGQFYLEVKAKDNALSVGCEIVLVDPIPEHTGDYPTTLEPGMYLVGPDIQPGIYKGSEADCYWERLKNVTGGFDAILTNGNSDGQFFIQVSKSDFAITTSCQVEFSGQ